MTLTDTMPTSPLVGRALIERIKEIGSGFDLKESARLCGYTNNKDFSEALETAAIEDGYELPSDDSYKEAFENNIAALAACFAQINYLHWSQEIDMFSDADAKQLANLTEIIGKFALQLSTFGFSGVVAAFTASRVVWGVSNYVNSCIDTRVTEELLVQRLKVLNESQAQSLLVTDLLNTLPEEDQPGALRMIQGLHGIASNYAWCFCVRATNSMERNKKDYDLALESLKGFHQAIVERGQGYLWITLQIAAVKALSNDNLFPNAQYSKDRAVDIVKEIIQEVVPA